MAEMDRPEFVEVAQKVIDVEQWAALYQSGEGVIADMVGKGSSVEDAVRRYLKIMAELAVNLFVAVVELHDQDLSPVTMKSIDAIVAKRSTLSETRVPPAVSIPNLGLFEVKGKVRSSVFLIDVNSSTSYFANAKSWTPFVIFNSLIMLSGSVVKALGGEFLEHTGDGALVWLRTPLSKSQLEANAELFVRAGEAVKHAALSKGLLVSGGAINQVEPTRERALCCVGAASGEVTETTLGGVTKLVGPVVWEAATNLKSLKETDRQITYYGGEIVRTLGVIKASVRAV